MSRLCACLRRLLTDCEPFRVRLESKSYGLQSPARPCVQASSLDAFLPHHDAQVLNIIAIESHIFICLVNFARLSICGSINHHNCIIPAPRIFSKRLSLNLMLLMQRNVF